MNPEESPAFRNLKGDIGNAVVRGEYSIAVEVWATLVYTKIYHLFV